MPLSMGEWEEGRAACFIGGGGGNKLFSKKGDSGAVIFTDAVFSESIGGHHARQCRWISF